MSKFPDPLPLSRQIVKKRLVRRKEMLRTARRGMTLRAVIILAEILGVFLWNSSTLFLDALSGCMDLIASMALIWCIRLADAPPDENHPLGHGRFEPIAGLFIGVLLVFLGIFSGIEQGKILLGPKLLIAQPHSLTWLIPCLGVILLEISYKKVKKTAKRENSPALMADAVHYRMDALGSFLALLALGLAAFFPLHAHFFDHCGAVMIALLMIVVGVVATGKNIHQLLDRTLPKEYFQQVKEAAMSVEGVLDTEKIRLQAYGPDAYVAIDIEVEPHLPVFLAHRLTQEVRRAIQLSWPAVRDVIVHVEPYYPNDHES